jgi:hypothetical protein
MYHIPGYLPERFDEVMEDLDRKPLYIYFEDYPQFSGFYQQGMAEGGAM